jgi:hypothetical protein
MGPAVTTRTVGNRFRPISSDTFRTPASCGASTSRQSAVAGHEPCAGQVDDGVRLPSTDKALALCESAVNVFLPLLCAQLDPVSRPPRRFRAHDLDFVDDSRKGSVLFLELDLFYLI